MLGLIWAQDPKGVIGLNGGMPWHYKEDFKRFKARTMGSTLIMGKKTWESLPKPLPGRRSLVVSRNSILESKHPLNSFQQFKSLDAAIEAASADAAAYTDTFFNGDVWVAGGSEVYRAFLTDLVGKVDVLDMTLVPEVEIADTCPCEEESLVTYMPAIPFELFRLVEETRNEADPRLLHRVYRRADVAASE